MKIGLTIGGIILLLGAVFLIGKGMRDTNIPIPENIVEQVESGVKSPKECEDILPLEFVKTLIPGVTVISGVTVSGNSLCYYYNENVKDGVNFRMPINLSVSKMFNEKEAQLKINQDREEGCSQSGKTCESMKEIGEEAYFMKVEYKNKVNGLRLVFMEKDNVVSISGEVPETNQDILKKIAEKVSGNI